MYKINMKFFFISLLIFRKLCEIIFATFRIHIQLYRAIVLNESDEDSVLEAK